MFVIQSLAIKQHTRNSATLNNDIVDVIHMHAVTITILLMHAYITITIVVFIVSTGNVMLIYT